MCGRLTSSIVAPILIKHYSKYRRYSGFISIAGQYEGQK